jgi:hypothetical protein
MRRRHPLKEVEEVAIRRIETMDGNRGKKALGHHPMSAAYAQRLSGQYLVNSQECGEPWQADPAGRGPLSPYIMKNEYD